LVGPLRRLRRKSATGCWVCRPDSDLGAVSLSRDHQDKRGNPQSAGTGPHGDRAASALWFERCPHKEMTWSIQWNADDEKRAGGAPISSLSAKQTLTDAPRAVGPSCSPEQIHPITIGRGSRHTTTLTTRIDHGQAGQPARRSCAPRWDVRAADPTMPPENYCRTLRPVGGLYDRVAVSSRRGAGRGTFTPRLAYQPLTRRACGEGRRTCEKTRSYTVHR
jgi:hypothetical protein